MVADPSLQCIEGSETPVSNGESRRGTVVILWIGRSVTGDPSRVLCGHPCLGSFMRRRTGTHPSKGKTEPEIPRAPVHPV